MRVNHYGKRIFKKKLIGRDSPVIAQNEQRSASKRRISSNTPLIRAFRS